MARDSWWNDRYPPSRPKKAAGGIKAQSKRGGFGESWWAKRWIKVLESFNIGARLARGRSYARQGQVLSIAIAEGKVTAKVQGSRSQPYNITIAVKTLSPADWKKVLDVLGTQALFAAKLLAGEMPQDIEPVFKEAGVSLFPTKLADLKTDCSCPDWSNPCKHIAAVYYLLGEEFDRDPFLIFSLRGLSRDALMARLEMTNSGRGEAVTAPRPGEPLSVQSEPFWNVAEERTEDWFGVVEVPREPVALASRLGGFPFWQGEAPLRDTLLATYQAASPRGLDVFLGPETESQVDRIEN
ncbi:SWIM zinc finger family protein [Singulisphaera acidiphila]|uniref:SWIM-type domain-containing protein n=1 Tax=Singulisphaera acidiphila (strain ATCC BAA-1392 / DSM 18658 / VKM B-2454 / MOB10) TaxID=886293 RepID=L0DH41_SINAD|nr:SWIM zinc finger family protein [Singulisphaera acidiphila]AGA28577.1 hypothetical protein Sinac_4385 [Singulisphaera acidiphila DSM 18658]